jgi:TetR/AcrR family transcriptional repressor of lmrAB and yxaGH operons
MTMRTMREQPAPETARDRILRAATRLFQQRSYHGVGLSEILAQAKAPKGSLYHHFPGGKAQLAVAAVESIAADYEAAFERWRARNISAADIVRRLARVQAQWLANTGWRQAGLFSVLALGFVPEAPALHTTLARVHSRRQQLLEHALSEDGADDSRGLAALALAALDGGMIQAAATRDAAVLRLAVERAARCFDQGIHKGM